MIVFILCINFFGENKGILVWRVALEQGDEIEAMTDRWASGVHSMLFTSRLFLLIPPSQFLGDFSALHPQRKN